MDFVEYLSTVSEKKLMRICNIGESTAKKWKKGGGTPNINHARRLVEFDKRRKTVEGQERLNYNIIYGYDSDSDGDGDGDSGGEKRFSLKKQRGAKTKRGRSESYNGFNWETKRV